MHEVEALEAKSKLGTLLNCVENGEEVVITRHRKVVARLVSNRVAPDQDQAMAAAQRIRTHAQLLVKTK